MSFDRRQVLGAFGIASASALLGTLGCGARPPLVRRAPQLSGEVRTWLHDAITRLAAVYPTAHALAVSRRRTTAALDVLGAGLARERRDGLVLTVRDRDGACREHVISELTADGVAAAATALAARAPSPTPDRRAPALDFGRAPDGPAEPPLLDELDLRHRVELLQRDATSSSRIIYAAAMIDLDDAIVWSVAPGHDLEQRLVRVRQSALRAAWNGNRPVAGEAERVWSGWLDEPAAAALAPADLAAANDTALELMTPGSLDDGERTVVLEPSVVAVLLDAIAGDLLTASVLRATRGADTALDDNASRLAAPLVTLIDDPTTPAAYGRFAFDDEGEPAAPLTLIDKGRITARLTDRATGGAGRGRRPGHLGPIIASPSHLQLVPGTLDPRALYSDGLVLEGGLSATLIPGHGISAGSSTAGTTRVRIACARARELAAGNATGRVYADVELVGSLAALLSAVDGVANNPASFALRSPRRASTSAAIWSSVSTPALRTRGFVRARRSRP